MKILPTPARMAVLYIAFSLLLSSCGYNIGRSGYTHSDTPLAQDCEVAIRKELNGNSLPATPLGQVSLRDGGFTTNCDEAEAMRVLREEACQAGANLVYIYQERQPNFGSTCYRCEATLYRVDTTNGLQQMPAEYFESSARASLPPATKENKAAQIIGGVVGGTLGFLFGYWLVGGFN